MGIIENIMSSVQNVFNNKMRSILTMLGIIIGIGSVIMITGIGEGVRSQTSGQFDMLGLNALIVGMNNSGSLKHSDYLKMDDIELMSLPENVTYVAPAVSLYGETRLKNPSEKKRCNITGTTEAYRYTQPVELLHGRFLVQADIDNKSGVIVIEDTLAKKVFGNADVVSQQISLDVNGSIKQFEIIGVVKGIDYGPFYDIPAAVYVPVSYVMDMYGIDVIPMFYISMADTGNDAADRTMNELMRLLSTKHGNEDKYMIQNMNLQVEMVNEVMGYLTSFVALVASISLAVGGIGVMNIMLVTVTERTREIGIRKSIGATDSNIKTQFLFEAVFLTLAGGILGIAVGISGSMAIGQFMQVTPSFPPATIIGTVLISSAIGIIFGVYPAGKAAKLDPIEALRYE